MPSSDERQFRTAAYAERLAAVKQQGADGSDVQARRCRNRSVVFAVGEVVHGHAHCGREVYQFGIHLSKYRHPDGSTEGDRLSSARVGE